jgi:antitoxin component YwqK of YwqJK toxin-antitoxin module
MITYFRVLPLLFLMFSLACKKSAKTFFDTGELKELIEINTDSSYHGKYKRFFISGNLAEESDFDNGVQVGVKKLFFENGKVEQETQYKDGVVNGFYKVYYESGEKKVEATIVNGKFEGIFKKYYEGGALEEVVTFKDDLENGPFEEYYKNGKLKWKGSYLNGDNEFGLLEHFDSTGTLVKTMQCDSMAICRTTWKKEGYIEPENN